MLRKLKILHSDIDMINEKMNELLLLIKIIDNIGDNYSVEDGIRITISSTGNAYNLDKIKERAVTLLDEFMKQYAI